MPEEEPITAPPTASIIVPSYRGAARLPALLDSLAAQEPGGETFEVIVVIDGVDDASVAVVDAETRLAARSIVFPVNRGRVAALNAGFAAARGEVLIRCDDDLVVGPRFVAAHVAAHRAAAGTEAGAVGVVGPTRDVHEDSAYARVYGRRAATSSYRFALERSDADRWRLWAADCSITRATWERTGPYSAQYRAYGWEDVDYGYRLHAAGIPIALVPEAGAEHHGPARSARARALKSFDSGRARAVFDRRHPEAPLAPAAPGRGAWGAVVAAAARMLDRRSRVDRAGRMVDAAIRLAPRFLATKLVAALVEAAGVAGARTPEAHAARAGNGRAGSGGSPRPRVAIAHDYLTQRGGAERLVLSICRAFPEAEVHTLFYEPDQTYPEYRDIKVRTSALNRIGILRRDPRLALPLLAPVASRLRIDADVVIASSSGWAHAFPATGRKLVYCHSPARWLYLPEDYLGEAGALDPKRLALTALAPLLRIWDRRAAASAERYWANSTVVRERIAAVYGIDAETLFPPFSPDLAAGAQAPTPQLRGWAGAEGAVGGHFLVVSRLQPYKHVDAVIEAFRSLPQERLLVIGKGPERERLQALAGENVRLVEGLSDEQMRWAYARARALIAISHEDFGLTPLEAGAHGKPVIALRAGGYLDTIRDGVNGVFVERPTAECVRGGVRELEQRGPWDPERIRAHADAFGEERFIEALRTAVADATAKAAAAEEAQ